MLWLSDSDFPELMIRLWSVLFFLQLVGWTLILEFWLVGSNIPITRTCSFVFEIPQKVRSLRPQAGQSWTRYLVVVTFDLYRTATIVNCSFWLLIPLLMWSPVGRWSPESVYLLIIFMYSLRNPILPSILKNLYVSLVIVYI